MVSIASVATALPENVVTQEESMAVVRRVYDGREDLLDLLRVFGASGVERRHLSFPARYYLQGRSFEERNGDFVEQAVALAERAAREALRRAGLRPEEIDQFLVVTTTGLATPSLDALLVPRLGLRHDVRRWPLFGLGCAAGAGAFVRAADLLRGAPSEKALVVSVELCGQVFSVRARTPADVVGAALFGDGAAAAVLADGGGPRILAGRTVLFEGTLHLMGWTFTSDGMRLRLAKEVPDALKAQLRPKVEAFLEASSTTFERIDHWLLHPGGRKILEAYRDSFGLTDPMLRWSKGSLAKVGNLSSASVFFVLSDVLESARPVAGDRGLMCGLGPGFGSELVLLEW